MLTKAQVLEVFGPDVFFMATYNGWHIEDRHNHCNFGIDPNEIFWWHFNNLFNEGTSLLLEGKSLCDVKLFVLNAREETRQLIQSLEKYNEECSGTLSRT